MKILNLLSIIPLITCVYGLDICYPGTTETRISVTTKAFSDDGSRIAWIEGKYKICQLWVCGLSGSCASIWDHTYVLKTAAFSNKNVISDVTTVTTGAGQIQDIQYFKQAKYFILHKFGDKGAPMTYVLVRPDERARLIATEVVSPTPCFSNYCAPSLSVSGSPSGEYIAIATTPGNEVLSLKISVIRACDFQPIVSNTFESFSSSDAQTFSWVADDKIITVEAGPKPAGPQDNVNIRVGTLQFDAAKKAIITASITDTLVSTYDSVTKQQKPIQPYPICGGPSTTTSFLSRLGEQLYSRVPGGGTPSNSQSDEADGLPVGTSYGFEAVSDPQFPSFQCTKPASRTAGTFPPTSSCACGRTMVSRTTSCEWSPSCSPEEKQTDRTKCSFFSSQLTCSKLNSLLSCSVVPLSTAGAFNEDSNDVVASTLNNTNPLDTAVVSLLGLVVVAVVVVVALVVRRRALRRGNVARV